MFLIYPQNVIPIQGQLSLIKLGEGDFLFILQYHTHKNSTKLQFDSCYLFFVLLPFIRSNCPVCLLSRYIKVLQYIDLSLRPWALFWDPRVESHVICTVGPRYIYIYNCNSGMNNLPFMLLMHSDFRHAMKAYRWSRSVAPLILSLGTTCRWIVDFTSRPLYTRQPLNTGLGGSQRRSRQFGEEKNVLSLTRFELRKVQPAVSPDFL